MRIERVRPRVFAPNMTSEFVITGSGFDEGCTVTIAGEACEILDITDTSITALSPMLESAIGKTTCVVSKGGEEVSVDVYVSDRGYRIMRALEPPIGLATDGTYDALCRIFGVAFDREDIDVTLMADRELFAETATDELERWERLYGLAPEPDLSLDERRARVLAKRYASPSLNARFIGASIAPYFGLEQDDLRKGRLWIEESSSYGDYGDHYWMYSVYWARNYHTVFNEPPGGLPDEWNGTASVEAFDANTNALKIEAGECVEREINWNGRIAFWYVNVNPPANDSVPLHVYMLADSDVLIHGKFDADGKFKVLRADSSWTSVCQYQTGIWQVLVLMVHRDIGYYQVYTEFADTLYGPWFELLTDGDPTKIRFESEQVGWVMAHMLGIGYDPVDLPYEEVLAHLRQIQPGWAKAELGWRLMCDVGRCDQDMMM